MAQVWEGQENVNVAELKAALEGLDDDAEVNALLPLCAEVDRLRARAAVFEKDLSDAAGELLVDVPEPGSVVAKLLTANILLRRENDKLRDENHELRQLAADAKVGPGAMSITVKLGYGERFLNWYATNTKLYIRGQQGKDWAKQRELNREVAATVGPWVQKQVDEATAELRARVAELEAGWEDPCPHGCADDKCPYIRRARKALKGGGDE